MSTTGTSPEARIIVRRRPDRKAELSVYDPQKGKETRTGMTVGPGDDLIDAEVLRMKRLLERAGNRVTVKEM